MDLSQANKIGEIVKNMNNAKYVIEALSKAKTDQITMHTSDFKSVNYKDYVKYIGTADKKELIEFYKERLLKLETELRSF
jgi:hypothetical protein